jgi:D-alanyl-D-alanine dipeptidase
MVRCLAVLASFGFAVPALAADAMPEDFVYLRDIDPTIQQDMRYAGPHNFTGAKVPGYEAGECVMVWQAAEALKAVQDDLRGKSLTLKVYDCYRPVRAVTAFADWAKGPDDPVAKAIYYPNTPKNSLFPNYIASRSGHSRAATVDLTLVPLEGETVTPEYAEPCTAPQPEWAADGSVAMGTTFDCFDTKSWNSAASITLQQHRNRVMLQEAMAAHGFKDYRYEWWHFTFEPEPYPDTYFDFPIEPRAGDGKG